MIHDHLVESGERHVAELTPDDLELERYLLDLSLQPLDRFDGFSHIEQYLLSALRYQLNYTCYALALAQYRYTPAFTDYLTEAQANTIEKMRDKRVWGYWAHECLLGYQRWDPDPIKFANVLYTGFFGAMLGMFETLNDSRFSEPGALNLRWNEDTEYVYEFSSLCKAIVHSMDISAHGPLYPCEPRLIYPMCNAFSLSTLLVHDRLHGTDFSADRVEQMAQAFQAHKYLRPDNRFLAARGPLKFYMGPSVGNDGVMSYWLHFAMPEQSSKTWENLRDNLIRVTDDDVKIEATPWETLDPGNYSRGTGMSRVSVMAAAKEHGDDELADAQLEDHRPDDDQQRTRPGRRLPHRHRAAAEPQCREEHRQVEGAAQQPHPRRAGVLHGTGQDQQRSAEQADSDPDCGVPQHRGAAAGGYSDRFGGGHCLTERGLTGRGPVRNGGEEHREVAGAAERTSYPPDRRQDQKAHDATGHRR